MSDKRKDGGDAFPNQFGGGMSLRDCFAGLALQGMLANEALQPGEMDAIANLSYRLADAMLKEREK